MSQALTPKQRAACEHYVANGGNKSAAYVSAGFSPNGATAAASRFFARPEIQAHIAVIRQREAPHRQVGAPMPDNAGNGRTPPPIEGEILGRDDPGPHGPRLSEASRLTRQLIIETLLRNAAICMTDEPARQSKIIKINHATVITIDAETGTLREDNIDTRDPMAKARIGAAIRAGAVVRIREEAIVDTVEAYQRDASGANRAMELLDVQLTKLEQAGDLDGDENVDGRTLKDFVIEHREKLNDMREALPKRPRRQEDKAA